MSSLEKEYYEAERFWIGDSLLDQDNLERIRLTAAMIPSDVESLVDVGCGNGVFVNYLQNDSREFKLLAIDRSATALKYVKTEKMEGDIANIPLPSNSFDCVTCLEVIEHLPIEIYKNALSELARISKKYVIISVPLDEDLKKKYTQCPSCKSIFNADLHLRKFDYDIIKELLKEFNYECVLVNMAGQQETFKGHGIFTKLFYPNHYRLWNSPICPICGFKEEPEKMTGNKINENVVESNGKHRSLISYFTVIPKLFWPKNKKYYWIIGLYKRK
jgi:SAM-dependent methyltransferase